MKVIHTTSWLSPRGGGIPPVIFGLGREFGLRGIECVVAGLQSEERESYDPIAGVTLVTGQAREKFFGYSPELSRNLAALVRPKAIVHSHGLWMHPGVAARHLAPRAGCPLVISPHGMLEPWALQNSRWKKRLAAWWFEDQNLHSAQCLHALCAAEAESFRRYGLRNPIAIIPNGVEIPAELETKVESGKQKAATGPGKAEMEKAESRNRLKIDGIESGQKILLFLSRLHPKKGLENLLQAWKKIQRDGEKQKTESRRQGAGEWALVIAGSGDAAYEQKLRGLIESYGLERSVSLCGPVYGEAKAQLLAEADGFVLPSFSEGFSMAVLEAAAAGLPVVLTHECNFPELAIAGAALEISPDASSVEIGLRRLLTFSDQERRQMGSRGRELMLQSYTWPAVADKMLAAYRWLLGDGPKPEFVF